MLIHYQSLPLLIAVALFAMGMTISVAHADEDSGGNNGGEDHGKPIQPAQVNAKWQQECSSCHIAYAPGLLPAKSWRKIMDGLNRHFGTDASLTTEERNEITNFLVNNASNRWRASTAPLRITKTTWFKREHYSKGIPRAVWKNPLVKKPANCQVCHTEAAQGDFSEIDITLPK